MPARRRDLVWFDGAAGLAAGVLVLLLRPWLTPLYALPDRFVVFVGVANLAYGLYSSTLARQPVRPRWRLALLIAANAAWAVVCLGAAVTFAGSASALGLAHLAGEGVFVGGLSIAEFRARERLRIRPR